ncbi:MAG: bifunctional (p)ppGpp synthetase/guanosine-3',5'-bis(diphosphate) 3'-pyrophosphohydrolase [Clostridia bacterium]|nr:bifunctional (p)ppGpp synthetase/guanosine-3',5'-bis(diphosphate) 3'-pyrophosphohydrolase [Clostridia bacterium]
MKNYTLNDKVVEQLKTIDKQFNSTISSIIKDQEMGLRTKIDTDRLNDAWLATKYWHNTKRRSSGQLFLYHPLAVFNTLFEDGFDNTELLIASLLHDTVEDQTGYTFEQMEQDFGSEVCEYVKTVTRISAVDVSNRQQREQIQREFDERLGSIAGPLRAALYIKFADRLDNLHADIYKTQDEITRYINHTQGVLIPLAKNVDCLPIAELLADGCFAIKNPKLYENIQRNLSSYLQRNADQLEKAKVSIKKACQGGATVTGADKTTIMPTPYKIAKAISKNNPTVSQSHPDLFSIANYRPVPTIYIKINNPTDEPLGSQLFKLIKPLLSEEILSIVGEESISPNMMNIYVQDRPHSIIRLTVTDKDFNSTLLESSSRSLHKVTSADKIKIYTKDGNTLEVDKGITVLDLAFLLNTEIGASYEGAIVNDIYVEPNYKLKNNDRVVIRRCEGYSAKIEWFTILESRLARNRLYGFFNNARKTLDIDMFLGIYRRKQ